MYETGLPLYLNHLGISFMSMGIIFGLAQIGILVFRYAAGAMSDRHGRKPFFVGSLALVAASTSLVPLSPAPVVQALLKIVRDAAGVVRDIMRSLVIYEHAGNRFVRWIGRAIGTEFIFMAAGARLAGWIITRLSYAWAFRSAAGLSLLACLGIWRFFRAGLPKVPAARTDPRALKPGAAVAILPPNLWVLAVCMFIFNIGLMTSHSFYLLLFFKEKFAFTVTALSLIQALHRLSLGIPTILASQFIDRPRIARHYKSLYVLSVVAQGVFMSLTALMPGAWLAVAVFLLHDLVGASFFSPIYASFVQRFARPERRGRDVALVSGLAALGFIFGPPFAGWLVDVQAWRDGPYIMSGLIIAASSLVLFQLKDGPVRLASGGAKAVAYPDGNALRRERD